MRTRILKSMGGFTLVELMVVVAIIGVLTSVAIPNFRKYQAKSKTSEAKLSLASIYTAEITLQSDYDNYATCLVFAGYDGATSNDYYATGFAATENTANANVVGEGGTGCTAGATFRFAATRTVAGVTATAANLTTEVASATVNTTGSEFTAAAVGAIDKENTAVANMDQWTIDEDKTVTHFNIGY